MVAALISIVGACLVALFLLTRRVTQLATAQAKLVQAQRADRTTQAALGRALQTLHVELNRLGSHKAERDALPLGRRTHLL